MQQQNGRVFRVTGFPVEYLNILYGDCPLTYIRTVFSMYARLQCDSGKHRIEQRQHSIVGSTKFHINLLF